MVKVPFYDHAAEYQTIKSEIDQAIVRVLDSGSYQQDKEVDAFEQEFATYCGVKHAVTTGTCYDAMFRGLLALGVGAGDEVITVANTDITCTAAIRLTGASFVWVDISPRTYNIDPTKIEQKITPRTKAILVVYMYGHPADMDVILDIAHSHNLFVLEDAAISVGASYKGKKVGSIGDIGCFSHAASKILSNYGDGGTLVTSNNDIAERARKLYIYSESERAYTQIGTRRVRKAVNFCSEGYPGRMNELTAAILRVKLSKIDKWIEARRNIAKQYTELLSGADIDLPYESEDVYHVYRNYTIQMDNRDKVRVELAKRGIETGMHYVPALSLQDVYSDLGYERGSLPITESASDRLFTLPIYPQLSQEQIEWVATSIIKIQDTYN